MMIDVRWVVLVVTVVGLVLLAKRYPKWIGPIGVGVAAAGLLLLVLSLQ
jgi:hypothetical protein